MNGGSYIVMTVNNAASYAVVTLSNATNVSGLQG